MLQFLQFSFWEGKKIETAWCRFEKCRVSGSILSSYNQHNYIFSFQSPINQIFSLPPSTISVHALKSSMYGWEKVQWWIRWRLLNDRYTLLSHQFHFQKRFRFPGLHPLRRAMCTKLTFIHRCCLQTPCFTHRPSDLFFFNFFLGLKFTEEFGAIYGKLYFSAILLNSLPWVRPSGFLHQWESYAGTEDGSQSNQSPDREQQPKPLPGKNTA